MAVSYCPETNHPQVWTLTILRDWIQAGIISARESKGKWYAYMIYASFSWLTGVADVAIPSDSVGFRSCIDTLAWIYRVRIVDRDALGPHSFTSEHGEE